MSATTPKQNTSLYRYFTAEAALLTIESRNLRIGRLKEMNDAFEWRPAIEGLIDTQQAAEVREQCLEKWINEQHSKHGFISFSKIADEPLLWAHYADKHSGICLEFEADSFEKTVIDYESPRPLLDMNKLNDEAHTLPFLKRLFKTKSKNWAYEQEVRPLFILNNCDTRPHRPHMRWWERALFILNHHAPNKGSYFIPIPDGALKRVILGYRCPQEKSYIESSLKKAGFDASVTRARLCHTEYKVLSD